MPETEPCKGPCCYEDRCPDCAHYWARMVDEGMWDDQQHRWTDKAIKEACK